MLILKEQLPVDTIDLRYVKMPYEEDEDARKSIVHVAIQNGLPYMWYDAIEWNRTMKEYLILAIGTGHYWSEHLTREMYIGSLLLGQGELVLHYFLTKVDNRDLNRLL